MNPKFYIVLTGVLLVSGLLPGPCLGLPESASGLPFIEDENTTTATVHGITYSWDTLEPINDTVIEINSTPPQSIVAKNGTYSFELEPGDYTITASYYRNNILICSKETTIRIESGGSYVLDLLLYPASDNRVTETVASRKSQNGNSPGQTKTNSSATNYLSVAFILLVLFAGSYKLSKQFKKPESLNPLKAIFASEPVRKPGDSSDIETADIETAALKKQPVSSELSETLDIIRGNKGRITQKDLRCRLKYSEVKVSLLLSELEKRGMIKKFKNGRENIVVLIEGEKES